MKVVEQVEVTLDWRDADLVAHPWPSFARSVGKPHLTEIVRRVAIATKQLDVYDDDGMPLRVMIGAAWEAMCVRLYPDVWWQPGEVERDGIVGTPDGLGVWDGDEDERVVEEWKYTAKSMRMPGGKADRHRDITREWLWMQQVMGYCNMVGDCRYARLHVCWARGNYEYPLTERYVRYVVRFDERELAANWRMVMANREVVSDAGLL